eukprot:6547255-Karenia_brevis.AAC.1
MQPKPSDVFGVEGSSSSHDAGSNSGGGSRQDYQGGVSDQEYWWWGDNIGLSPTPTTPTFSVTNEGVWAHKS